MLARSYLHVPLSAPWRRTPLAEVTQCLGGLAGQPWYLVVARPSGSTDAYPRTEDLVAFKVPPHLFIKLERGTWHAGLWAQRWQGSGRHIHALRIGRGRGEGACRTDRLCPSQLLVLLLTTICHPDEIQAHCLAMPTTRTFATWS